MDFAAIDPSGGIVWVFACRWLRDYAPEELFWGSAYGAGKRSLSVNDLNSYQQEFKTFIQDLQFQASNPQDEDDYDKWISEDGNTWIDSEIYSYIQGFIHFLEECIQNNYSARWSI